MVIMALAFNMQAMAFGKADAQAIVSKFYSCLKIIAEENYTSDAPTNNSKNAYNEALELCFDTDINMPNDFNDFGFSGGFSGNDWFLQVGTYLKRLREFAIEKKNVRYTTTNIKEVRALEEIKHRNTENSTNFYAIFVDKRCFKRSNRWT